METLELENTIPKRNNSLVGLNSRDDKDRTNELRDLSVEFTQSEQQRENRLKKMNHLRDLWNNNKRANIHIIKVLEGEDRGTENIRRNDG